MTESAEQIPHFTQTERTTVSHRPTSWTSLEAVGVVINGLRPRRGAYASQPRRTWERREQNGQQAEEDVGGAHYFHQLSCSLNNVAFSTKKIQKRGWT